MPTLLLLGRSSTKTGDPISGFRRPSSTILGQTLLVPHRRRLGDACWDQRRPGGLFHKLGPCLVLTNLLRLEVSSPHKPFSFEILNRRHSKSMRLQQQVFVFSAFPFFGPKLAYGGLSPSPNPKPVTNSDLLSLLRLATRYLHQRLWGLSNS